MLASWVCRHMSQISSKYGAVAGSAANVETTGMLLRMGSPVADATVGIPAETANDGDDDDNDEAEGTI